MEISSANRESVKPLLASEQEHENGFTGSSADDDGTCPPDSLDDSTAEQGNEFSGALSADDDGTCPPDSVEEWSDDEEWVAEVIWREEARRWAAFRTRSPAADDPPVPPPTPYER